jgi:hypothetical protein
MVKGEELTDRKTGLGHARCAFFYGKSCLMGQSAIQIMCSRKCLSSSCITSSVNRSPNCFGAVFIYSAFGTVVDTPTDNRILQVEFAKDITVRT